MRNTSDTGSTDVTPEKKRAKVLWAAVILGAIVLIAFLVFAGAFTSEGSDPAGQSTADLKLLASWIDSRNVI